MERELPAVIDNGTFTCKIGIAGDDHPKHQTPTILGRLKNPNNKIGNKDHFVGEEAIKKKNLLNLNNPIEHGIIKNWDDMTKIWHHTLYNVLRIAPQEHPCLLTEPALNPKANREKTTEIMFETFGIPAFYLSIQAALTVAAAGRSTGLSLDSGEGVTQAVPIVEGKALSHAIERWNLGGGDVTESLKKILHENGHNIDEIQTIRDIKQHCYFAMDYESELKNWNEGFRNEKFHELPDGQMIAVDRQRFQSPEILFKPLLIGKEMPGFHEMVYQSITKCDDNIRRNLYNNIIVGGGNTMFEGMQERLYKEITCLAPQNMRVKTVTSPDRKNSVWIGGSIVASLSTFQDISITKAEYQDRGADIVNIKC